jgi:hypothetical protein
VSYADGLCCAHRSAAAAVCRSVPAGSNPGVPVPGDQAVLQFHDGVRHHTPLLLLLLLSAGLSLQSQILTFLFLVIRLYCSFMMEYDIHTLLDALTLVATVAVIYALTLTPIKNTYQNDLDSVRWYYVVSWH